FPCLTIPPQRFTILTVHMPDRLLPMRSPTVPETQLLKLSASRIPWKGTGYSEMSSWNWTCLQTSASEQNWEGTLETILGIVSSLLTLTGRSRVGRTVSV